MSKRFYPEHQGDRKRAKLDISISDHNFPLSQNNDQNKDGDGWGDDNDDEILLLASQACEQAYNTNDISLLPDYSLCMQPGSTSTQLNPAPSTSKTEFTFKKPSQHTSSIISTHLKEKCNRISSPLPGITSKIIPKSNDLNELSDEDFMFSDKIYKGQDSDHTYRQLLKLQEENAKLKSENGKLLEKCVTKEGEASILRTQLKSCQISVDHARMEKIKAQEKVQMEWTDKLTAANNQMQDLRTQLDFKNLEIISIKEKCKKLESTKVRMTQVTVSGNDISSSQRRQSSSFHNESMTQNRRVKVSTSAAQTEDKAQFMILTKTIQREKSTLSKYLPLILEASPTNQYSIIDYNEKLSRQSSPLKCRVYSTFVTIATSRETQKTCVVQLSSVYEDLSCLAGGTGDREKYFNVFSLVMSAIAEVQSRLEIISRRMTTAFQKEMDEKFIEATLTCLEVTTDDLLRSRSLFKEEQEILARRLIAMFSNILETSSGLDMFRSFELSSAQNKDHFLESISRICSALDNTYCGTLYSGLLYSITLVIQTLLHTNNKIILEIIKTIISCRAMPHVVVQILVLVRKVSLWESFKLCPRMNVGNLKMDYDQGVVLYSKDSCYLQVLLKQVESCLKCIEKQNLTETAIIVTRQLLVLSSNICDTSVMQDTSRCDCQIVLIQVIVYALRICAVMLNNSRNNDAAPTAGLVSVCLPGARAVLEAGCARARDAAPGAALDHCEGHLVHFCEIMRTFTHEHIYAHILSELAGTSQSSPEEMPPCSHRQPWLKSFDDFSLAD